MPAPPPARPRIMNHACQYCGGCLAFGAPGHAQCRGCACVRYSAPVSSTHPQWLPRADPNVHAYCRAQIPEGNPQASGVCCTRPTGHERAYIDALARDPATYYLREYDHAAHIAGDHMVARWATIAQNVPGQCHNCGESPATLCNESDNCRRNRLCTRCCRCNRAPLREQVHDLFYGDPSARYPRFLGIEIECGKTNNAKVKGWNKVRAVADKWGFRIGTDGSILNFAASSEISTTPSRGDAFQKLIAELGAALIAEDIKANSSCGLHVHVDVRDYMVEHEMNCVLLYSMVEPAMYGLVAPSRRDPQAQYCKAWGDVFKQHGVLDPKLSAAEREKKLDVMMYGNTALAADYKRGRSKHNCRYHGLNLNAIPVHGTIEFRMHHGTVNPTKILMWSAICSAIVEYAFRHSEAEIRALSGEKGDVTHTRILEKVVKDREVIRWMRMRRLFFKNQERKRLGLPPLSKKLLLPEAHAAEMSEDSSLSA